MDVEEEGVLEERNGILGHCHEELEGFEACGVVGCDCACACACVPCASCAALACAIHASLLRWSTGHFSPPAASGPPMSLFIVRAVTVLLLPPSVA